MSIGFSAEKNVQPNSCTLSIANDLIADLTMVMNTENGFKCQFAIRFLLIEIKEANFRLYDSDGNLMQHEVV